MTQAAQYQPIFEVTRGNIVESIHAGSLAVVNKKGELIASYGNPDTITFLRSSSKPFQALPFIEDGGDQIYHLTEKEIAIICASHSGTDEHVAVLKEMQKKIGIQESDLRCGAHLPLHKPTAQMLQKRGETPTENRHNCSGKHTGMLAYARMLDLPIDEYLNPKHPIQQKILNTFSEMCAIDPETVELGIDGCTAPVFAIPLRNAALGYARLCDPGELPQKRADACRKISKAMTTWPNMVAGPGRFDTVLMTTTGGRIVAKGGAEGYQGMGILPGVMGIGSPALGIAIKIGDGDLDGRALPTVALEVLRQLGAISTSELEALSEFGTRPVYNWRKIIVGEARANFKLQKPVS